LQLLLIPFFLRVGEWIFSAPPVSFSPTTMFQEFFADPVLFFSMYGKASAMAVVAWALIMPLVSLIIYVVAQFIFSKMYAAYTEAK